MTNKTKEIVSMIVGLVIVIVMVRLIFNFIQKRTKLNLEAINQSVAETKKDRLEAKRQKIIKEVTKTNDCKIRQESERQRLWDADCQALGYKSGCALPLSLTLIIDEKLGCEQ